MKDSDMLWKSVTRDFILDDLDEAICVLDKDGTVIVWNKKSELIYDLPKEEIIGKNMDDVLPGTVMMDVLRTKKDKQNIYKSTRTGCNILVKAKAIYRDGRMIGVMCVDKDLSEIFELEQEVRRLKDKISILERKDCFSAVFTASSSPQIEQMMVNAAKISKSDANIIISGESGVGKENLAQKIHEMSKIEGEFVKVNCGTLNHENFEEEFMGEEDNKGIIKEGYFDKANKGTLFLADVGKMPIKVQAKLLEVLQNGKYQRLGGKSKIPINIRIISSSNSDIMREIDNEAFIEELFYRLKVLEISVPPLRERGTDVLVMAENLIEEAAEKYKMKKPTISPRVRNAFLEYDWKGNILELGNTIEHMVLMSGGKEITMEMLPSSIRESVEKISRSYAHTNDLQKSVREFEKQIIKDALEGNDWNRSQTARMLNIPRTTLMYKIEAYDIKREKKSLKKNQA